MEAGYLVKKEVQFLIKKDDKGNVIHERNSF